MPLAAVSVRQPAGSYLDEAAWANPTVFVKRWLSKRLELGVTFLAPVAGALGGEVYSGGVTLDAQR
jgi:hypothetical protein